MPIHDWTRVDAGIFHAFHHDWISEIAHALNRDLLPGNYYVLPEQISGQYGPDVLTLQGPDRDDDRSVARTNGESSENGGGVLTLPKLKPIAETHMEFYRRKQNAIAVRHVSDDGLVAMIEIVSPGNKTGRKPLRSFVEKAADHLLDQGIHLLIIDLFPPGKLDPQGIHGEIWPEIDGTDYAASNKKTADVGRLRNWHPSSRVRGSRLGWRRADRHATFFGTGESRFCPVGADL